MFGFFKATSKPTPVEKPKAGLGRAGFGRPWWILNTIRVLNLISLLLVLAASSIMIVKTFVVSKFFFFDAISHVITGFLSIFLMTTEVGLFKGYYSKNWPLLSLKSGFLTLGIFMIVVGVSILGNLNKDATSQQSLGLSFWQIVICSGILTTIMGIGNIVVSYIFRDTSLDVTARMIRKWGIKATDHLYEVYGYEASTGSPPREFLLNRSNTGGTVPSYQTDLERGDSHVYRPNVIASRTSSYGSPSMRGPNGLKISGPTVIDEEQYAKFRGQTEDIRKPDLACHPALQGREF